MDFKYIINQNNELCEVVSKNKYALGYKTKHNEIYVSPEGKFKRDKTPHKYDVKDFCTMKSHPELYLWKLKN